MSLIGKTITLKGITQKGKNRVRKHGERWTVLAQTDRVLFAPGMIGPWLFITPIGHTQNDVASRWIKKDDDSDFNMTIE